MLQCAKLDLISFQVEVRDGFVRRPDLELPATNAFFDKLYALYNFENDQSKWKCVRGEVFTILSGKPDAKLGSSAKSLQQQINDEIVEELREDAENNVIAESAQRYGELLRTGYFKINQSDMSMGVKERERLVVMGATLHQVDNRNYQATVAIVDKYGELLAH